MRKKILILIFNLFYLTIYSQNNEIEAEYEIQGYFKNFKNFDVENLKTIKFNYIWNQIKVINKIYERENDFEVFETKYNLDVNYVRDKTVCSLRYEIIILKINESIIGLVCYENVRKKTNYYFDYNIILKLISEHNTFYETQSNLTDFVDGLIETNSYGYACGFAPVFQKTPSYEGLKYSDRKNSDEFRKLLKSYNIEKQNYGLDALEFLEKGGKIKLNENDKKIINHIKKRNSLINTCSGCNFGLYKKRF